MRKYGLNSTRIILFVCCSVLLLGTSCKKKKQYVPEPEIIELSTDLSMDELSDSTFFSMVKCLVEYDGDIYASLAKRLHIVRMDKDLKLKTIMGGEGRGPGEFGTMSNFAVGDSIIWAGDANILALRKFSIDGKYFGVEERSKRRYALDNRYWVEGNKFYFGKVNQDKETSLAILDLNQPEGENDYKEFGEYTDFGTPVKNGFQNGRDVFVYKDHIIAVPRSIPAIEKYDKNTLELVEKYDLTQIKRLDERYATAGEASKNKPNNAFFVACDSYLKDNLLYVVYRFGIFVFDISDDIKYVKRYQITSPWKICVTDDYIYGAPLGGGIIDRYPLDK